MHEITTVAEIKRLYGKAFDADIDLAPPVIEIGTQHKYAWNILLDFKPGESPMLPEAAEILRLGARPVATLKPLRRALPAFPYSPIFCRNRSRSYRRPG